jgi:hypothetical protein
MKNGKNEIFVWAQMNPIDQPLHIMFAFVAISETMKQLQKHHSNLIVHSKHSSCVKIDTQW